MKKFFSMIMIAAAALSFAACSETPEDPGTGGGNGGGNGTKLETPAPEATNVAETEFTIAWAAITGADSYTVNLKGKNYTTAETSYTFKDLNAGEYTVRVKATGEGYKDSDFGTVTVTLTGATSVSWFESSVKPAELNEEEGYGPYNAVEFTWKGTGVASLAYGFWYSDALIGVSDTNIKAELDLVDADTIAAINSAEGLTSILGPIPGGSNYTMVLLVTNESGVEFYSKEEVATEAAQASAEAQAWLGTWTVNSTKEYHISVDEEGNPVTSTVDNNNTFNVTITASVNDPNQVIVDGWSVLGEGNGFYTIGEVDGDTLYILNGTNLGMSEDGSYAYYWVGWYNDAIGLSTMAYPSNVVTLNGDTATSTNKFDLYDQNNNPVAIECYASDVFALDQNGYINFVGIKEFPAVYRTGDMTWAKSAPSAQSFSMQAKKNLPVLPTSLVVK